MKSYRRLKKTTERQEEHMIRSRTYIAVPPGATIREQIVSRGMSQKEFALRMGMPEKYIMRLLSGDEPLTPDAAMRLETVLGIPSHFWNKLEALYREKLVMTEADAGSAAPEKFPYGEMQKNGQL